MLYQIEVGGGDPEAVKIRFWDEYRAESDVELFTSSLVKTYEEHAGEIDKIIATAARNWDFDRIARVDRNILRVATAELLFVEDVPPKVTLNEAIEIAKKYGSTEKSYGFINGVLDRIMRENVEGDSE